MKIELYLDGNKVEINKDIDFVLNKQFTELTDLTSIIVDYSKTIKVPMTAANNELFNNIYKLERQILVGTDYVTYDPSQKIPMTMLYNNSLVMEGYAILSKVNLGDKTYEINLYGQLGKIFSELKEKTIENYSKTSSPFFNGIRMSNENILKSLGDSRYWNIFKNVWSQEGEERVWHGSINTGFSEFFGFAPQLYGKSDDLDTKSMEVCAGRSIVNLGDVINTQRNITYGDSYIGDGLDFNQYGELRSYMTRPFVYVDKLIQLVQHEINDDEEKYDGYQLKLDPKWFNPDNPYYYDLCYFPGRESIIDKGSSVSGNGELRNISDIGTPTTQFPLSYSGNPIRSFESEDYTYQTFGTGNKVRIYKPDGGDIGGNISFNFDGISDLYRAYMPISKYDSDIRWAYYNSYTTTVPIPYIAIYDGDGNLMNKVITCDDTIVCVTRTSKFLNWEWTQYTWKNMWSKIKARDSRVIVPNNITTFQEYNPVSLCAFRQNNYSYGNVVLNSNTFEIRLQVDIVSASTGAVIDENVNISGSNIAMAPFKNDKYRNVVDFSSKDYRNVGLAFVPFTLTSMNYRSGSTWTIYDILGNDFNPFTWLIDYVKKHRLYFDIDYNTKTITLTGNYFDDVSYKKVIVDYGKEVTIEPLVNVYNKVDYGYSDNESKKASQYRKNHKMNYGDIDISTGININNETMHLIPNEEESVMVPTNLSSLTWNNLKTNTPISYSNYLGTGKIINTLGTDGEIKYFPFYAFRTIQPVFLSNDVYVTDDTPDQMRTGNYRLLDLKTGTGCWDETLQPGINYPYLRTMNAFFGFDNYLTIDDTTYWATFGIPNEVYNGNVDIRNYNISIYNRWENYLNEIFNPNNKKVTCYVLMSYPEFIDFKFNQLFVIDNNIFLVNKIIDFNPNSSLPTKVELIQIGDVNNLK